MVKTETTLPAADALANKFLKLLRKDIGLRNYKEVCARNAAEPHKGICHSHDFCDANMVMLAAVQSFCDTFDVPETDAHYDLWNAAWNLAVECMVKGALAVHICQRCGRKQHGEYAFSTCRNVEACARRVAALEEVAF